MQVPGPAAAAWARPSVVALDPAGRPSSAPYRERRALLENLDLYGPSWRTPPAWFGGGAAVLAATHEQHLEGVVAKQVESTYQPGERSRSWLKIKNLRTQEVLIAGWRPGQGRRVNSIGSLLLAIPTGGGLRYAD